MPTSVQSEVQINFLHLIPIHQTFRPHSQRILNIWKNKFPNRLIGDKGGLSCSTLDSSDPQGIIDWLKGSGDKDMDITSNTILRKHTCYISQFWKFLRKQFFNWLLCPIQSTYFANYVKIRYCEKLLLHMKKRLTWLVKLVELVR